MKNKTYDLDCAKERQGLVRFRFAVGGGKTATFAEARTGSAPRGPLRQGAAFLFPSRCFVAAVNQTSQIGRPGASTRATAVRMACFPQYTHLGDQRLVLGDPTA